MELRACWTSFPVNLIWLMLACTKTGVMEYICAQRQL
jgi:hypothetical protein